MAIVTTMPHTFHCVSNENIYVRRCDAKPWLWSLQILRKFRLQEVAEVYMDL